MLLIGSGAIKQYYTGFREPKDLDIVINKDEFLSEDRIRIEKNTDKRVEWLQNPVLLEYTKNFSSAIASPDIILTLKASHLFWNIQWHKHISDVMFLVDKGHNIIPKLFYDLYNYWNKVHGEKRRSNLDMTAEDFFDNALKSEYSHDYLHTLLNPSPTYLKVLKDGAEVDVSEDKFNALSFEEKCDLVREEVMVMAYERYKKCTYFEAYGKMLKKFVMGHAPLWEAIFIIQNFKILKQVNYNFFKKIDNALNRI